MANHMLKSRLKHRANVAPREVGTRLTEQHHHDACDAHKIIDRYARSGVITHMNNLPGRYLDLPDALDYETAHATLTKASEAFSTIPADIRAKFHNSPQRFLEALHDPSQREYMTQAGFFNTISATKTADGTVTLETVPPAATPSP